MTKFLQYSLLLLSSTFIQCKLGKTQNLFEIWRTNEQKQKLHKQIVFWEKNIEHYLELQNKIVITGQCDCKWFSL